LMLLSLLLALLLLWAMLWFLLGLLDPGAAYSMSAWQRRPDCGSVESVGTGVDLICFGGAILMPLASKAATLLDRCKTVNI